MSTEVKNSDKRVAAAKHVEAEKPVLEFGGAWEYAPAPESRDHVRLESRYGLFINGAFVAPKSRKHFDTINPATEEKLAEVAEAGAADVDAAVRAAEEAHRKRWSKLKPAERGKYIYRVARLLQEKSREFAVLESLNGGKPIKESRDVDIPLAVAHFFYHAGWADKLAYAFPRHAVSSIGVCGQIIPWNFPLLMAAWKIAPALACGNTVVLKPAETTPLTAMHLAKIFQEADLPPGVVNILPGAGETGAHLVNHPRVRKIAFTGSTEVGKLIQRATAGTGKRLTLELGGKAANIIFEDAALDQAVEGIINGIYFNQGHVCCAGSRLLVQESVADDGHAASSRTGSRPCASATRSTRTPTSARSTRRCSSRRSARWSRYGVEEGAAIHQSACKIPSQGLLVPADLLHRRRAVAPHRPRGDLRPRARRHDLPHARRRRSRRPTTSPTACRPASGPTRARRSSRSPRRCEPASCGRTPSTSSTRPPPSAATRSPASAARAACTAYVPTWSCPESGA